jgi:4-oxalocrotonate tautomerase
LLFHGSEVPVHCQSVERPSLIGAGFVMDTGTFYRLEVHQRSTYAPRSHRSTCGKVFRIRSTGGQIVYKALTDILNAPKNDLFQVISEHAKGGLQFDRDFLGIHRSDDCVFVQITLNRGRTVEMKERFYKAVADELHENLKLRREDVFINLVEAQKENWFYGMSDAL